MDRRFFPLLLAAALASGATARAQLTINKSDGGVTVASGSIIGYVIQYCNTSSSDLDVVISDPVPLQTVYEPAVGNDFAPSCVGGETSPAVCSTAIRTIAADTCDSVFFRVRVAGDLACVESIANAATVTNVADPSVSASSGVFTPVIPNPDLAVVKSDGGISAAPGDTIPYSVTVLNNANVPLSGIVVTEAVPVGTVFNAAASSPGWSCAGTGAGSSCTLSISAISACVSTTRVFAVTLAAPIPAGLTAVVNTASVADDGARGADPIPDNNQASDSTPITGGFPDLTITKTDGGAMASPGGGIAYTLALANVGTRGASGVQVTETVPQGTTFGGPAGSWTCSAGAPAGTTCTAGLGTLAAGSSTSIAFDVAVDPTLPAGFDTVVNTATVADDGANGADPNLADNQASESTPVTGGAPDLTIAKTDGGATASPGGGIAYTLSIENVGSLGASGVEVMETVPQGTTFAGPAGSWTCSAGAPAGTTCTAGLGTLAAGASASLAFNVTVDPTLPAGFDTVVNTATVADDGANGADANPADNQASDSTPVTGAVPDLTIAKTDGGATASPGGGIAYTLSIENAGTLGASGVEVTETVPQGTTFAGPAGSWSCSAGAPAGTTCTAGLGTLVAGSSASLAFNVTVDPTLPAGFDTVVNTATVADDGANGADANPADNQASDFTPVTGGAPDLTIAKTDGGATASPGGGIAYTLSIENVGSLGASGTEVTETVPQGTSFAGPAGSWSCSAGAPAGTTCTAGLGTLAAGSSASLAFNVTVDPTLPAGFDTVVNTATVADDGANGADANPADNQASDSTPVTGAVPDLTIAKTDGGATTSPGGGIAYSLSIENAGTLGASGVEVTETVPQGTTFAGPAGSWSCSAGAPAGTTCTAGLGTLVAGSSASLAFNVTVDSALPAGFDTVVNTTSVSDDGAGGADANPADNQATETTPITGAAPDLATVKSADVVQAGPGDTITYTIVVSNGGSQGATGVVLSETVPDATTFDAAGSSAGWSCADGAGAGAACTLALGGLAAGATATRSFAVTVVAALPAGVDEISNVALVADDGANGPDGDPTDNDSPPVTVVIDPAVVPDLALAKSDGGETTSPGATLAYTLTVENRGLRSATGVVVTETVPAGTAFAGSEVTWSCAPGDPAGSTCIADLGTIDSGESVSLAFELTVNPSLPAGLDVVTNTASVADDGAGGADPNPADNQATETTPITGAAPDLATVKSADVDQAGPGDTITYSIVISNDGTRDSTAVVVSETVPVATSFAAAGSSPGWSCADGAPAGTGCTLEFGSLAAGETATLLFAVTVVSPIPAGVGEISNVAGAGDDGGNGPDGDPTDNDSPPVVVEIDPAVVPDLTIAKDDGGATAAPGGSLSYTLTVENGGLRGSSGVRMTETVPAGTVFAGPAGTWTCAPGDPEGSVCVADVGTLEAGESVSLAFELTVGSTVRAGLEALSNTVTVEDDGTNGGDADPANNEATETTPVDAAPDLAVSKRADVAQAGPGDTITFTIAVSNGGTQDSTGVVVAETVPLGTVFAAAGSSSGWTCSDDAPAGTACSLAVGNLGAGESAVRTFAVAVVDDLPPGLGAIENVASVGDDGAGGVDPNPGDNESPPVVVEIDPQAAPDLVVTKTADMAEAAPGDTITYTLTYTNAGLRTATGVLLVEAVPAGTVFESGPSSPFDCDGSECLFAIASLAPGGSGTLTFAVVVVDPSPFVVNTVEIADDGDNGADPTPSNNRASVTVPVVASGEYFDHALGISDDPPSVYPGGLVTYTMTVTNLGTAEAPAATLTYNVPDAAKPEDDAAWTCEPHLCSHGVPALGPGETHTVTAGLRALPEIAFGTDAIRLTALVEPLADDPDPTNNSASETTPVLAPPGPDVEVEKLALHPYAVAGQVFEYLIVVTDRGPGPVTVELEEVPDFPAAIELVEIDGWSCDGDGLRCTLSVDLGEGESVEVPFWIDIPTDAEPGTFANTAVVTPVPPHVDPMPEDNSSTTFTELVAVEDIPTLGEAGAALLVLSLLVLGIRRLRRARA